MQGRKLLPKERRFFVAEFKPDAFLCGIPEIRKHYIEESKDIIAVLEDACWKVIGSLQQNYHGFMCPGWLENVETGDEMIVDEYYKRKEQLKPLLYIFPQNHKIIREIKDILNSLYEKSNIENREIQINDPNQLKFDF